MSSHRHQLICGYRITARAVTEILDIRNRVSAHARQMDEALGIDRGRDEEERLAFAIDRRALQQALDALRLAELEVEKDFRLATDALLTDVLGDLSGRLVAKDVADHMEKVTGIPGAGFDALIAMQLLALPS